MDKLYVERACGRWEAWTIAEGKRVYLVRSYSYGAIERYAHRHHFRLIHKKTNPE